MKFSWKKAHTVGKDATQVGMPRPQINVGLLSPDDVRLLADEVIREMMRRRARNGSVFGL